MEIRNIVEIMRQWYQKEVWYVRKGLEKITEAETANLPPVLSPTRPKCNFTIRSILVIHSWIVPGLLMIILTHTF